MKSLKRMSLILGMIAMVLCLSACSKKTADIKVDPAKLAEDLQAGAVTSEKLTATSLDLSSIYYVKDDQVEAGAAYLSNGSTACEVAVIECKDAAQAAEVEKLFKQRIADRTTLFASYNADEVAKLDHAIVKTSGKYAVLCICDDTAKAEEILKQSGF